MPGLPARTLSTFSRIAIFTALASAASAIAIKLRTNKTERENPPTGKFVEVDGVRLHYREHGDGPPLVLLHGNGAMHDDFELSGLTALASGRYRTIVFDRVGFGHSERPRSRTWGPRAQAALIREAFDRLGIVRPIVLGHSWGTQVALSLALDYPADVRSLVLLSGYYFPTFRPDVLFMSIPAIPLIGDLMRHTISPWAGRLMWPLLIKKMFAPSAIPPHFARFPKWMSLRPSQLRAAAAESGLMIPDAFALRSRYGELKMPVFIMAGAKDRIVDPVSQSARLHRAIPHSTLHVIPDTGHMIHHIVPDKVMELIEEAGSASVSTMDTVLPIKRYSAAGIGSGAVSKTGNRLA